MVFYFTRDSVKILISLYEQNPELYNVRSAQYKNKNLRNERIHQITNDFNNFLGYPEPPATEQDIKKKINSLRTQFFAEVRNTKKSSPEVWKSNWWCFEELKFLLNEKLTNGEKQNDYVGEFVDCNLKEEDDEEEEGFSLNGEDFSRDDSPIPVTKKRRRMETENMSKLILKQVSSQKNKEDHLDVFGMLVSAELKTIKSPQKVLALKRRILNCIYEVLEEEEKE